MKTVLHIFLLLLSNYAISQIIQPSYHAGYQAYAPPITAPTGGNAICDGTTVTIVNPVTSPSGKIWMDRNLGASRQATSKTDFQSYGCLYQWGRGNDGHASINWTSTTVGTAVNSTTATLSTTDTPANSLFITNNTDWRSPKNDALWQGLAGTNNPCPSGYRLPTITEYNTELSANSITDLPTGFSSVLKFSGSGIRNKTDGTMNNVSTLTHLYTSTINSNNAYAMWLDNSGKSALNISRSQGSTVRCIKD